MDYGPGPVRSRRSTRPQVTAPPGSSSAPGHALAASPHTSSGIIHIESDRPGTFTLVSSSTNGVCASFRAVSAPTAPAPQKELRVYVDRKRVSGTSGSSCSQIARRSQSYSAALAPSRPCPQLRRTLAGRMWLTWASTPASSSCPRPTDLIVTAIKPTGCVGSAAVPPLTSAIEEGAFTAAPFRRSSMHRQSTGGRNGEQAEDQGERSRS